MNTQSRYGRRKNFREFLIAKSPPALVAQDDSLMMKTRQK
jgi:hypothetical protein